jgi:hypothetical protein
VGGCGLPPGAESRFGSARSGRRPNEPGALVELGLLRCVMADAWNDGAVAERYRLNDGSERRSQDDFVILGDEPDLGRRPYRDGRLPCSRAG